MIKAAITDELLKPKEQRSAIYTGVHGTDTSFFFFWGGELLFWINNEYGKDGIMLNIDCRKYLFEHAENFVKRYEANPSDASNKADALYFVNILKESAKKEALKKRLQ